jgi:GT2 family glycosyltransferase
MTPIVSIIIVSYNTREILRQCLQSVMKSVSLQKVEIFVVDNSSLDGSADMVEKEFKDIKLIRSSANLGFAGGNNLAIPKTRGEYLLLLNPDSVLTPDTLEKTIEYMDSDLKCGILGIKLKGLDGSLQPCARKIPNPFLKFLVITGIARKFKNNSFLGGPDYSWWDHNSILEVGWVVGAYFLFRRELIADIGLLDERYFLYFEEIDFCLQAKKKGWKVIFFPFAEIMHIGGQSSLASNGKVSSSGKQLIKYRIKSEFRFYRKNFNLFYVIATAFIEASWHFLILLKNSIFRNSNSIEKRKNSKEIIQIIFSLLKEDKFGKESRP